jgi:hypothetical protein
VYKIASEAFRSAGRPILRASDEMVHGLRCRMRRAGQGGQRCGDRRGKGPVGGGDGGGGGVGGGGWAAGTTPLTSLCQFVRDFWVPVPGERGSQCWAAEAGAARRCQRGGGSEGQNGDDKQSTTT